MDNKDSKHDPGWNDPPLFSYDEHNAQRKSSKPRNILNKRISFPLESSPPPTATIDPTIPPKPCDPSSLPPPPVICVCPAKIISAVDKTESESNEEIPEFNSLEAFSNVVVNFNHVLNSNDFKLKYKSEIERRLNLMKTMWSDGKLNEEIQRKLLLLSEALKDQNYKLANDLQIGLMVDHATLCSHWMSGIRNLIQYGLENIKDSSDP